MIESLETVIQHIKFQSYLEKIIPKSAFCLIENKTLT